IRYIPLCKARMREAACRLLRVRLASRSRKGWVRTQRAAFFSERTFLHPPHRTRRASFPCTRLSIILHPLSFLLEFHFVLMDAFCSMFFDMTFKAYRFEHLWSVICLIQFPFSRLDPIFMMRYELRCFSAPLTTTVCSLQRLSSIALVEGSLPVAMPTVLERR